MVKNTIVNIVDLILLCKLLNFIVPEYLIQSSTYIVHDQLTDFLTSGEPSLLFTRSCLYLCIVLLRVYTRIIASLAPRDASTAVTDVTQVR